MAGRVTLPDGVILDLSGLNKGMILDRLAERLTRSSQPAKPRFSITAKVRGVPWATTSVPVAEGLKLIASLPGVSTELWDGDQVHASPGWPGVAHNAP